MSVFFTDTKNPEIYTLSLHDALPILTEDDFDFLTSNKVWIATDRSRARRCNPNFRSEERFSRNAETDLVCRLLLEKKNKRLLPLPAHGERVVLVERALTRVSVGSGHR